MSIWPLTHTRFLQKSVEYMGHRIDKEGLHPTQEKVEAIISAPKPSNITEIRSFLGLLNYYSWFLKKLSSVAASACTVKKKKKSGAGPQLVIRHSRRESICCWIALCWSTMTLISLWDWPVMHPLMGWAQSFLMLRQLRGATNILCFMHSNWGRKKICVAEKSGWHNLWSKKNIFMGVNLGSSKQWWYSDQCQRLPH